MLTDSSSALLEQIFPARQHFAIRLWDGRVLPSEQPPRFTLVIRSPSSLRRMFRPPLELALGEAFMSGDFDVEGDFFAIFGLMDALPQNVRTFSDLVRLGRVWSSLPNESTERRLMRSPAHLSGAPHSRERDRAAIAYHYDAGNDFYSLWLDSRMNYSCAYFKTGTEELDAAQEAKLELICRKLRLKPGERLLDIGCGWGALAMYAAQRYSVNALGVTLSQKQYEWATERIARAGLTEKVRVKLLDYRDLSTAEFDKIASIGMFEHVGSAHLPEYFAQAYRLLRPGGLFLNHGISVHPQARDARKSLWARFVERFIFGTWQFQQRYIFPDGELEAVSEVNLVAERAGFEVRDMENLREHYALTLRHWVARLDARRRDAIRLAGEPNYRAWRLYMSGSAFAFESGAINVNQSLLAKPRQGAVDLPLTRADLYAPC